MWVMLFRLLGWLTKTFQRPARWLVSCRHVCGGEPWWKRRLHKARHVVPTFVGVNR